MLHLDNLFVELQNQPEMRGYIIVYAPSVGSKSDTALAYAARMRKYLVVARALKAERITVTDGGFREKLSYETWLVPLGIKLPVPNPTVSRKNVKLKRGKTRLRSCGEILGWICPAPPNNGMHPTANQRASHRKLAAIEVECAAGDAGR